MEGNQAAARSAANARIRVNILCQEKVDLNTTMVSVDATRANTFAERKNLKTAILEAEKLRN